MDAQDFVRNYVSTAFGLARVRPTIRGLHEAVQEIVAKEMEIPIGLVKHIHHSIHWSFFLEKDCPFQIIEPGTRNAEREILPSKKYDKKDINARVKLIMGSRGPYIQERLSKYCPAV